MSLSIILSAGALLLPNSDLPERLGLEVGSRVVVVESVGEGALVGVAFLAAAANFATYAAVACVLNPLASCFMGADWTSVQKTFGGLSPACILISGLVGS